MNRIAFILICTIGFMFWLTCACMDDEQIVIAVDDGTQEAEPPDTSDSDEPIDEIDFDTVIFVLAGSTGDGTSDNPFGSIQEAVDFLAAGSDFSTIFVGAGVYQESIVITTPLHISGGYNPDSNWEHSSHDTTLINGTLIQNQAIAFLIHNVDESVTLSDLCIRSTDAVETGAGSYGMVCMDCADVTLHNCHIYSGDGMAGYDGIAGVDGEDGDNAGIGWNSRPGQNPVRGGEGGWGATEYHSFEPGDTGLCADGSRTGGAGGRDWQHTAQPGPTGLDGINGAGGSNLVFHFQEYNDMILPVGDSGQNGTDGEYGCGGGGGRGGITSFDKYFVIPGGCGGGGGAGAYPGTGAKSGGTGGMSVGMWAYQSNVTLTQSIIISGNGGKGGDGGMGGSGGSGGLGDEGEWMPMFAEGNPGAPGGNGGKGGDGGGGTGGASFGIAYYGGTVTFDDIQNITYGNSGLGGWPYTSSGDTGLKKQVYNITISPENKQ